MDNFMNIALQVTGVILCLIILIRSEPALNRMGSASPPMIVRLAFALLATGAIAAILAVFAGKVPDLPPLILAAGTAALILCERRIRILTRIRTNRKGLNHAQR